MERRGTVEKSILAKAWHRASSAGTDWARLTALPSTTMSKSSLKAKLLVRFTIRTACSSVFTFKVATSVRHNSPEGFKIEQNDAIEPFVFAG